MTSLMRPPLLLVLLLASLPGLRAAAGPAPLAIVPGRYAEFEAPFAPQVREFASDRKKLCASTGALAAVAVPPGFTPDRPWPVLLVSATSDPGYNSSRRLLREFMAPALEAGWIVIAADAASDRDEDTNNLRYALLIAALARLQQEWPRLGEWPRAFGGFSGGAKRSAWLAAIGTRLRHPPIGVFQAGCNEAALSQALDAYQPDRARFLGIPVYLSGGSDDRIAPPDAVADVESALRREGFSHVRSRTFHGDHEVHAAHLAEALRWFAELAATAAPRK